MKIKTCASFILAILGVSVLAGSATELTWTGYNKQPSQTYAQGLFQWDQMAQEVADAIDSNPSFAAKTVFVDEDDGTSPFLIAFKEMIKTELMKRNFQVVETPSAALVLYVQTQLVQHTPRSGAYSGTVQAVRSPRDPTAGTVMMSHEMPSELLVVSTLKQNGVSKMSIDQIAYVNRDEDYRLYGLSQNSSLTTGQPNATVLEVTNQP